MDMPTWYELRVQGHIDADWSGWFDPMSIVHNPDGTTTLRGPVADQATLYGLISKVRDLGLTLLEVTRRQPPEGPG